MEKCAFLVYYGVIRMCRNYLLDSMPVGRFCQRNTCISTSMYVFSYMLSNDRLHSMSLECPSYYPGRIQCSCRHHFIAVSLPYNFHGKYFSATSLFPSVSICPLWPCYCICDYTSRPHDGREIPSKRK